MKIAIGILFALALLFFALGRWSDSHSTDAAGVPASIVAYVFGAMLLAGDGGLLIVYALWRLFT